MEPVITEKNSHLQLIITLGLIGLLLAVVGGYIYYGMQQAKQEQVVVEIPVAPEEPASQDPMNLTAEERQAILDELSKESPEGTTPLTEAERAQVLENLKTPVAEKTTPLTEAEKADILESLTAQLQPSTETAPPTE